MFKKKKKKVNFNVYLLDDTAHIMGGLGFAFSITFLLL